eukprot:TRINITY_DN9403_c0_g1_i1.p1 TRINITY_DN9403_c0_g1~~TRINITY_DN9403_c0_g1_i1.p1  ORF type:complete len:61 (+),score=2.78 TRINITY_DN9403_c0_g1_i1:30-212(+)
MTIKNQHLFHVWKATKLLNLLMKKVICENVEPSMRRPVTFSMNHVPLVSNVIFESDTSEG